MKPILFIFSFFVFIQLQGQSKYRLSVAFTDNASAYPFAVFTGFVKEPIHPGVEFGWSRNFREKKNHDWFRDVKLGYFYHRFVQHGIPLYVNYGYRYKFSKTFNADAALGAGYFHSIAATEVLKLDDAGNYKNAKGIGRPQAMAALTIGTGYVFYLNKDQPVKLFLQYQARIQTPFVKSYVPILPYNQAAIGISFLFPSKKK